MSLTAIALGMLLMQVPLTPPSPAATTPLHFSLAPGVAPYTVKLAALELACTAPCRLDVPRDERQRLTFESPSGAFARNHVARDEVTMELVRPKRSGLMGGGIALLSVGAAIDAAAVIVAMLGLLDVLTFSREGTLNYLPLALGGAVVGTASIVGGVVMMKRSRPVVREHSGAPPAAERSPLRDTFRFSVAPTRDGFSAGAGFRF